MKGRVLIQAQVDEDTERLVSAVAEALEASGLHWQRGRVKAEGGQLTMDFKVSTRKKRAEARR